MLTRLARALDRGGHTLALHPFLFAAYPVLLLYAGNLTEVGSGDVLGPLIVVLVGTTIAFGIVAVLWRAPLRAAIVVSAVVVPLFLFSRLLRAMPEVLAVGRDELLVISVAGIAVAVTIAIRVRERLGTLTLTLNVVALVLVALQAPPIASSLAAQGAAAVERPVLASLTPGTASDPDIWYLVFDRYGSANAIELEYGISDNELLPWLREQGFQVLESSHANYIRTNLSLSATLNMEHLDRIAARMGPDSHDYEPIHRGIRDSLVARLLKRRGYRYIHIGSWYEPTRKATLADANLNPEAIVSFGSTLYEASALPLLASKLGLGSYPSLGRAHADAALFQFEKLHATVDDPGPKFVLAHVLLPHPPYVFTADGRFDPAKAAYSSQLRYTNRLIQELVTRLLDLPEEDRPVIIVQADEGPRPDRRRREQAGFDWSNASTKELAIKFGILNAMYLPGAQGDLAVPDRLSSVNTFRMIFRRYFGADLADLPDRSYASSNARPYAFNDITDRLAVGS